MHVEQGYCPIHQDTVSLLVVEEGTRITFTCPKHTQFSHTVTLTTTTPERGGSC